MHILGIYEYRLEFPIEKNTLVINTFILNKMLNIKNNKFTSTQKANVLGKYEKEIFEKVSFLHKRRARNNI